MVDDEVVMQVFIMDSTCLNRCLDNLLNVLMESPTEFSCVVCGINGILRCAILNRTVPGRTTGRLQWKSVRYITTPLYSQSHKTLRTDSSPIELDAQMFGWMNRQPFDLARVCRGSLIQGPYKKSISLKVERSDIGQMPLSVRLTEEWSKIQVLKE